VQTLDVEVARVEVPELTSVLGKLRADVTRDDVLRAIKEYDRLGPDAFFAVHGYGASRSFELVWKGKRYPHKALLGTAYELATGQRLDPGDFEGGKAGAVAVLQKLGFDVEART
jgi:hypothetical protein